MLQPKLTRVLWIILCCLGVYTTHICCKAIPNVSLQIISGGGLNLHTYMSIDTQCSVKKPNYLPSMEYADESKHKTILSYSLELSLPREKASERMVLV